MKLTYSILRYLIKKFKSIQVTKAVTSYSYSYKLQLELQLQFSLFQRLTLKWRRKQRRRIATRQSNKTYLKRS